MMWFLLGVVACSMGALCNDGLNGIKFAILFHAISYIAIELGKDLVK